MNLRYSPLFLALLLGAGAPTGGIFTTTAVAATVPDQDDNHYYGIGIGRTYEDACESARGNLLNNIMVTIEVSSSSFVQQKKENGGVDNKEEFSHLIKSYSGATTLHNLKYRTISTGSEVEVECSVSKKDVEKMYEQRREKVLDLVRSAQRAESRKSVDNALRYLYQAYVLLHSLRYPTEVKEKIDGQERILLNWIPERMNEICQDVKFSVVSNEGNFYNCLVTYKGEPAVGIDYSYWNGRGQSPIMSAKDGISELEFPEGVKPSKVDLMIEYEYRDEVHADPQVAPLLLAFNGQNVIRNNQKQINVGSKESYASKAEKATYEKSMTAGQAENVATVAKKDAKELAETMDKVVRAINDKKYDGVASLFTEEGYKMFNDLLGYGKARLLAKPEKISYKFYPMKERTVCRSVPMSFAFEGGKRKFIEDVTFTFDGDGKIESLAFSLGSVATDAVFSQGGDQWSDLTKMTIVSFLENYKTAFALKRLDYIKSIFDDEAYIIVGHVVKKATPKQRSTDGGAISLQQDLPEVKYAQKTKAEYMDQLEKCFKSNEFVNIRFADNDIAKAGYGGETFGIQIKQDYSSSSYGDHGYLFLMVDFNNEDAPVITIRTWQPERMKDLTPKLKPNNRDFGIFSLGYFS